MAAATQAALAMRWNQRGFEASEREAKNRLVVAIPVLKPAKLSGAPKKLSAGRIENTVEIRADPRYAATPAPSGSARTHAASRRGRAATHAVPPTAPMRA